MRFAHVIPAGAGQDRGSWSSQGDEVFVVEDLFPGAPRFLEELIAGGDELLARVRDAAKPMRDRGIRSADVTFASAAAHPAGRSSRSD